MPHINIKHFPRHLDADAQQTMAQNLTRIICSALECPPNVVSIAMEPVAEAQWQQAVVEPEIMAKRASLIQFPNYEQGK